VFLLETVPVDFPGFLSMRPTPQLPFWSRIYSGITEFLFSWSSTRVFQVLNTDILLPSVPSNNLSARGGMSDIPALLRMVHMRDARVMWRFTRRVSIPPNLPCLNLFHCLVCATLTLPCVWCRTTTLWLWSWTLSHGLPGTDEHNCGGIGSVSL
jgi:hypothetical protein